MTRLAIRVSDFVRANPGLTLNEIARGVHARTSAVREVLNGKGFVASSRGAYGSDRAQVYTVAPDAADGPGRPARLSQNDRIARVLADGHFHTTAEIHKRVGFCRLNSRIAELRDPRKHWNLNIVCERVPGERNGSDAYRYRLVGTSEGAEASPGEGASAVLPGVMGKLVPASSPVSEVQLSMEAAA